MAQTREGSGDKGSGDKGSGDKEPKGGRPGPKDEGRDGGMATREIAPELTEPDDGESSD